MERQPAYINYFFKGGYLEFGRTIKNAFQRCGRSISHAGEQLSDAWGDLATLINIWYLLCKCVTFGDAGDDFDVGEFFFSFWAVIKFFFFLFKLIFVAILTTIVAAIMSVLHGAILIVFFLLTYLYFGIVKFFDFTYNHLKKISTSCPACQRKYALPAYVCECGETHTKLVPSRYGIMKRKCLCGRKLKASFLNGRHKLPGQWICPHCGYNLKSNGLQIDISIPVVGGPSSGKTCYINMALMQLEKVAPKLGLDYEYVENEMLDDPYAANKANMESGNLPEKTNDMKLKYYQFKLTPKKVKVKNLISFCDVAGEAYSDSTAIGQQIGYRYAAAFMIVIDPLAIEEYRNSLNGKVDISGYGASEKSVDEVLSLLVTMLENMYSISSKDMLKTNVAVLFSKSDIPGLDELIGEKAVKDYLSRNPKIKDTYEAQNKVCEEFLREYDELNFLNNLKAKFKSVQFFTCSALGHNADGSEFIPQNVCEPILWVIDKCTPSIDFKKLRSKLN